ncbi:MAG: hypothetical protein ACRDI2_06380 [Chloroflexota bacterium]
MTALTARANPATAVPLADPDLHLFLADDEIASMVGVARLINQMRRESTHPVLAAEKPWELHHIQPSRVLQDPEDDRYKCWYLAAIDDRPWPYSHGLCLATSRDGMEWERPALDVARLDDGTWTNIVDVPRGTGSRLLFPYLNAPGAGPGERFVATFYQSRARDALRYDPPAADPAGHAGIYRAVSADGVHWTVSPAPVVRAGDRYATAYDPAGQRWLLTTRLPGVPGVPKQREVALWESADLQTWDSYGTLLRADEHDRPNTEFYSLLPVRYGAGFVGLLEVYHRAVERLDTQLCWSRGGRHWRPVGHRDPVLSRGGEGTWDSHWVYVTNNDPEPLGDRLRFWYGGGGTHHGSKGKHRRQMGVASIRRDGFVSIEGRMDAAFVLTAALEATESRRLTVNLNAATGAAAVEVWGSGAGGAQPVEGFSAEDCRLSASDGVRVEVTWRGGAVVPPQPGGRVHLRFHLRNASLYSYRWSRAAEGARP